MRDVEFASAFSFKYSPRPGTPAAAARKHIPDDVKDARLQALNALLFQQQDAFKRSCKDRMLDVLFEKPGRQCGQAIGRSPYLQAVHVDGAIDLIGQIRPVRIDAVGTNSLKGSLISSREKVPAH